jgi:hypothetical protein
MYRLLRFPRWLVVMEIGVWRSLFLFVARRKSGVRPGVEHFSYHRQVAPVIGAFIFVSLVELPVVHLLIPWHTVRLVVLVISVWGLLWMVGYFASVKVFPHLLDDAGLRVRFGTTVDVAIPWELVESVRTRRGRVDSGKQLVLEDGILSVPVMKQTRIEVVLREPTALAGFDAVTEVRLYADRPADVAAAARERLGRTSDESARQKESKPP